MVEKTLPVLQEPILTKFKAQEAKPKRQKQTIDGITVTGTGEPHYAWKRSGGKAIFSLHRRDGTVVGQNPEAARVDKPGDVERDDLSTGLTEPQFDQLANLIRGHASSLDLFEEIKDSLPSGFFDVERSTQHDLFFHDGRRYQQSWFDLNDVKDVDQTLDECYIRVRDWKSGAPDFSDEIYLNDFEPLRDPLWMLRFLVKEITSERKTVDDAVAVDRFNTITKYGDKHFGTSDGKFWLFDPQQDAYILVDPPSGRSADYYERQCLARVLDGESTYDEIKEHDHEGYFLERSNNNEIYLRTGQKWVFDNAYQAFELFNPRRLSEVEYIQNRKFQREGRNVREQAQHSNFILDKFKEGVYNAHEARNMDWFDTLVDVQDDQYTIREGYWGRTYRLEDDGFTWKRASRKPIDNYPGWSLNGKVPLTEWIGPLEEHKLPNQPSATKAAKGKATENGNPSDRDQSSPNERPTQRPRPPPGGKSVATEDEALRKKAEETEAAFLAAQIRSYDLPDEVTLGGRTWAGPRPQTITLTEEDLFELGDDGPQMTIFGIDRSSPAPGEAGPDPSSATAPEARPSKRKPSGRGGRKVVNNNTTEQDKEEAKRKKQAAIEKGKETKRNNKRRREEEAAAAEEEGETREREDQSLPNKQRKISPKGATTRSRAGRKK
ncbi:MAG: hypothetical protein M1812_001087 [Candelaria pacifica]|nr:MAG: hypothetical protein M1812_001087 [Candelaria pacifica]